MDSGADLCMFHAGFCGSLGIGLDEGIRGEVGGIIGGRRAPIYYHKVKILIGSEQLQTMAGFCEELSVGGILGRRGFFENFVVKIDSSTSPPFVELDKIHRA